MRRVLRITFRALLVAALFAVGALAGGLAWARYGPPPLTRDREPSLKKWST